MSGPVVLNMLDNTLRSSSYFLRSLGKLLAVSSVEQWFFNYCTEQLLISGPNEITQTITCCLQIKIQRMKES